MTAKAGGLITKQSGAMYLASKTTLIVDRSDCLSGDSFKHAISGRIVTPTLDHEDPIGIIRGIDPETRPCGTAPTVETIGPHLTAQTIDFANIFKVILAHQFDRGSFKNACSAEFAFVQEHLTEFSVIRGG